MKNYIKPEIEVLTFQTEDVMQLTLDLGASNVTGGFEDRQNP